MRAKIPTLVLLISVAACAAEESPVTTEVDTSPTTEAPTTAPPASPSTSSTSTSTTEPTTTTAPTSTTVASDPDQELTGSCENPEGFSLSYPGDWHTNSGEVVSECGQFHPETFEVPEGTDERVAAITAYVDPVGFAEVAAPDEDRDAERAVTAVDGKQAVRLEYEAGPDGLWPEGTPITMYAVDVSTDEQPQTLFIDTVGVSDFDYEASQRVLDRMIHTVDLEMEGVEDDPDVVAAYRGGGGGFDVEGTVEGSEACLRIPPDGEQICTELPADDQLHTIQLEDLEPVLAGVTGSDVFAVTAHLRDDTTSTALPVPVDEGVRGFSFAFGLDRIEQFVLTDVSGNQLRTIEPGG